jgi:signal transduction histidine kinase
MLFFDPTVHSMVTVLRRIELTLLGVTIFIELLNEYSLGFNPKILYFAIFCALIMLFSIYIPLGKSIWYRQIYAGINMTFIILANVTGNGSELLLYWTIVKISFFLDLSNVIFTVLASGIIHSIGIFFNYSYIVGLGAKQGTLISVSPHFLVIQQISYYTGASIFCILLSNLVLSEQRSRIKTTLLTEEVKNLAANLERQRIAQEIHDSLGHSLTALDIQLELAQKLQNRDLLQMIEAINQAKKLTSQCLQDVRWAVQNLYSEPFDLQQSLETLITQFQPAFNIQAQIDLPNLPLQPSHQLYCILQEGFTNIQKHAFSTKVWLRSNYDHQHLWINLQDNGRGFEQPGVSKGFGLRNMAERAQLLGGFLQIESVPEQGTNISISIPLMKK